MSQIRYTELTSILIIGGLMSCPLGLPVSKAISHMLLCPGTGVGTMFPPARES